MQCSLRVLPLRRPFTATNSGVLVSCRQASLTGAINRGIRKTQRGVDKLENRTPGRVSTDAGSTPKWQDGRSIQSGDARRTERSDGNFSSGRQSEVRSYASSRHTDKRGDDWQGSRPDRSYSSSKRNDERGGGGRDFSVKNEWKSRSGDATRHGQGDRYETRDRSKRDVSGQRDQYREARSSRSMSKSRDQEKPSKSVDEWFMDKHEVQQTTLTRKEKRDAVFGAPYSGKGDSDKKIASSREPPQSQRYGGRLPYRSNDGHEPSERPNHEPRNSQDGSFESRHSDRVPPDFASNKYSGQARPATERREYLTQRDSGDYDADRKRRRDGQDWDRGSPRHRDGQERVRGPPRHRDGHQDAVTSPQSNVKVPMSIPYTTAGSEFLYGTFVVRAALKSGRRKLYKLYVYQGLDSTEGEEAKGIPKLALAAGVKVATVTGDWDKLLYKMSEQRPHNGYVLEVSPLPKLPVTALETVSSPSKTFALSLGHQTAEDVAVNSTFDMNGSLATIPAVGGTQRYPLVLMLDSIKDPGNLGAIIRSAYFLGVDAVVLIEHGTAPISPVVLKTSAGAAEYLPLLTVKNEHAFMKSSQENGWTFFAASSPDSAPKSKIGPKLISSSVMTTALSEGPCVLLLGSEGEGIRPQLLKIANGTVGVESARGSQQGLDSLNVSVAAALLMQEILQGPSRRSADSSDADSEPSEMSDLGKVAASSKDSGAPDSDRIF